MSLMLHAGGNRRAGGALTVQKALPLLNDGLPSFTGAAAGDPRDPSAASTMRPRRQFARCANMDSGNEGRRIRTKRFF